MRTRATRRPPLARRAPRAFVALPRVTRAMREPWWGPHPAWAPIVCRRRPRPRGRRRLGRRAPFFRG